MAEYERMYEEAERDPEKFWGDAASQLHWFKPWDKVREWDCPWAKWFSGGQLNLSYNCLDRHVATWRRKQGGYHLGGRTGRRADPDLPAASAGSLQVRQRTQIVGSEKGRPGGDLYGHVSGFAIAMLACARIGAPHTIIFGGFSANALVDRITDSQACCVVTQDGSYRRGSEVKLKPAVDEAVLSCPR